MEEVGHGGEGRHDIQLDYVLYIRKLFILLLWPLGAVLRALSSSLSSTPKSPPPTPTPANVSRPELRAES